MKAVMYHYVRPKCEQIPYFKHLDFDDFRRQLDFFQKQYGFILKDEFLDMIKQKNISKHGVVLTFDDGLSDHYHYVFKELQARDLWGCFFISQQPYLTKHLLNVHRVHLLLGLYGGADVHKKIEEFFDLNSIDYKESEIFKKSVYLRQTNDEATTQVKKIINYYLSASEQNELLDKIAQKYLKESIEQYYLLPSQIQQMNDAGMLIGSHGVNHSLMSKLNKEEQTFELCESFSFIKQLLGPEWLATYCHPYGGKLSYNAETLEILKNLNCVFGFAVDPRDIVNTDFDDNNIYTLPRSDCNQFPFGKAISIL